MTTLLGEIVHDIVPNVNAPSCLIINVTGRGIVASEIMLPEEYMRRSSVEEYTETMRQHYTGACRTEKSRLLDEFIRVTGYHRKSAVRVLSGTKPTRSARGRGRPSVYGPEVRDALWVVWEVSDRLCGKRLAPFVAEFTDRLVEHGELTVSDEVREQLNSVSASTIDRLLRRYKDSGLRRPFSTTKPGSLLKSSIPIRTFAEWEENSPGFIEMDLVAHCGNTTEGFYLNTLSAVDIATGWVECQAVWGKGQQRVGGAVHKMSRSLPFRLLGLDSDNGSEFINRHLYSYCQRNEITFTRSRPYRKNDSAHIEQKNWSVVRRLIGYGRYTSRPSLRHLERVYSLVGLYVNFFQPVMKLKHKSRNGARVHKVYDTAQTPYHRLLEYDVLTSEQRTAMQRQYELLNPVRLKRRIDRAVEDLLKTAERHA